MARSRNLKPGFFKNEDLSDLGPEAMLLFAGLWTIADREGRLEDRIRRIAIEVFPFRDVDVEGCLSALNDAGFIARYQVNGMRYIQITNFLKHQNPHKKERPSEIPDMPGTEPGEPCTSTGNSGASTVPSTEQAPGIDNHNVISGMYKHGARTGKSGASPADSLNPLTDSLNPLTPSSVPDRFHEFWERYPSKVGQDKACRMWVSVVTPENVDDVFDGLSRWEASERWKRGIFHDPANWLLEKLWLDSPPPPQGSQEDEF